MKLIEPIKVTIDSEEIELVGLVKKGRTYKVYDMWYNEYTVSKLSKDVIKQLKPYIL